MIDTDNEGTPDHPDLTSPDEPVYETDLRQALEDAKANIEQFASKELP